MGNILPRTVLKGHKESATKGKEGTGWQSADKIAMPLGVRGVGSSNLPVPTIRFISFTIVPSAFTRCSVLQERAWFASARLSLLLSSPSR